MITPNFLHYLAIGIAISLGSIGSGIGQGIGALSAVGSLSRQDLGNKEIFKTMIVGLAFIESGIILALVITLIMLLGSNGVTLPIGLAEIGISLMIGIAATSISISSGMALKSSVASISRQPFFTQKILNLMIICLSMMEAPVVFSFIIALLIRNSFSSTMSLFDGIKLFAASLSLTIGCIGPSVGLGVFTNSACYSAGLNTDAYNKLFPFSIINGAVIQTPLIFSLLLSILTVYMPLSNSSPLGASVAFLAAALAMGISSLGSCSAAGFVASKTCRQIALGPENYSVLFRSNILSQAFIESSAIYALLISMLLIRSF